MVEANDKWESMPSKPKLTIVFGLALLLVVSFITYVTVYAADGRGNVGKDSNPDTVILHEDTAHEAASTGVERRFFAPGHPTPVS